MKYQRKHGLNYSSVYLSSSPLLSSPLLVCFVCFFFPLPLPFLLLLLLLSFMDSTNSGSNQSSSSGDNEEFDDDAVGSRADLSSFLNLLPSHPPPPVNTSFSSSIFDSFSPYFAPFPFPPPPEAAPLSLQASAAWSSLPPPLPPSPPPPPPPQPLLSAPSQSPPPRGAKKRTRASRRAPTTVINTEASNFRAMVQQFTGFPTPPFAAAVAAPFPARPRLDLFGAAAAGVVPPFLLRPSAHNMIPSPLSSSSSSSSSVASFFDRTISPPSHFATTVSATADSSNAIPPKYRGHDKFNLSLLNDDMQRQRGGAAAASFDAPPPPPFLQPPRSQMAALPQFPTDSGGAMNPGWDVEPEQDVEEPAPSKILIRNFQNNQS